MSGAPEPAGGAKWRKAPMSPGTTPSRRGRIVLLLSIAAALVVLVAVALPYLRPAVRSQFAPLCVTAYRNKDLPPPPWRVQDRAALVEGNYFACEEALPAGAITQAGLVRELTALRQRHHHGPLVVYLSAYARTDVAGRVQVLPADADLNDSATWLPLRRILELLSEVGARRTFLILDLIPAHPGRQYGWLLSDIMARVPDDLKAVPDGNRLVLCSHSPGQVPHASEVLGNSVFGYYLVEGLRGWADTSGEGRVTARELAAFVRSRVDRWARRTRQTHQTPILHGEAADFNLIDLLNGAPTPTPELPEEDRTYPSALADAWKKANSPERKLGLLAVERAWRAGGDPDRVKDDAAAALQVPLSASASEPRALSLALASRDRPLSPDVGESLRRLLFRADARLRTVPKDKAAEERSKLAAEFVKENKTIAPVDLLRGALDIAVVGAEPERLAMLAALVREIEKEPEHIETLALLRVASLNLPPGQASRALDAVRGCEKLVAHPRTFNWMEHDLEDLLRKQHEAKVLILASGYASREDADKAVRVQNQELRKLLPIQGVLADAIATLTEARQVLPSVLAMLESNGQPESMWHSATAQATELGELLDVLRTAPAASRLNELRDKAATVRGRLEELGEPFTPDGLDLILRDAGQAKPLPKIYQDLEGVLATTQVAGTQRAAVWQAAYRLSRRLEEEVLRQDLRDGRRVEEAAPPEDEDRSAIREAQRSAGLLGLFGGKNQGLIKDLSARSSREDFGRTEVALQAAWKGVTRQPQPTRLWAWLADRYRYLARDYSAVIPDSPEAAFFQRAAREYTPFLPPGTEEYIELRTASADPPRLLPDRPIIQTLEVRDVSSRPVQLLFRLFAPDTEWLDFDPNGARVLTSPPFRRSVDGRWSVDVRMSLKPGAGTGQAPVPQGILAQVREKDGRTYHLPLRAPLTPRPPQVLLSGNEKAPFPELANIGLRAVPPRQPVHLFVKNPVARPYAKLVVKLSSSTGEVTSAPFALKGLETQPVKFAPPMGPPPKELPELTGPLRFQVIDLDNKNDVLSDREVSVGLARPADYVAITSVRFDPLGGKNRLTVRARLRQTLAGPPVTVELGFPPSEDGGATHGTGTLKAVLPPDLREAVLTAEGVKRDGAGPAMFYVSVDGWARAFVFEATLRTIGTVTPSQVMRPIVRPRLPPTAVSSSKFALPVEADNAPLGAKLDIVLGRLVDGAFRPELRTREETARKEKIGFTATSASGALEFEATQSDWAVNLDTTGVRGAREVRARLLDRNGSELASAAKVLLLGDTRPAGVRFIDPPTKAWNKRSLLLKATGADPVAGIKEVYFFLGAPTKDDKVPDGAKKVAAEPDGEGRIWSGKLDPPGDAKGEKSVTVEFVNKVNLRTFATIGVEFSDTDPDASKLATLRGKVFESDRAQKDQDVVLADEKGAAKATVKTNGEGAFEFKDVPPGKYRITVTKSSGRKGAMPARPKEFLDVRPGAVIDGIQIVLYY